MQWSLISFLVNSPNGMVFLVRCHLEFSKKVWIAWFSDRRDWMEHVRFDVDIWFEYCRLKFTWCLICIQLMSWLGRCSQLKSGGRVEERILINFLIIRWVRSSLARDTKARMHWTVSGNQIFGNPLTFIYGVWLHLLRLQDSPFHFLLKCYQADSHTLSKIP